MDFIAKNYYMVDSTDGCQTDISVFHPDGNFNQYELVCFGIGYIQNHSTLLSNVYL